MALQVGDKVPPFSAIDTRGDFFNSDTLVGHSPFVIYFYPKDNTRVCTEQACSFRDQYEAFKSLGAEVIGVSGDSVQAHQNLPTNTSFPSFCYPIPIKS